jgi:biotin synthase
MINNKYPIRHDWKLNEVLELFNLPFNDLLFQAQICHRQNFNANKVQLSSLISIKSGSCPEDCAYCPQSAHFKTNLEKQDLLKVDDVVTAGLLAKQQGATRFCMGAAWRQPTTKDFPKVLEMISKVKAIGMETCVTLGMLNKSQTKELKNAGLDYYNHNLDTSEEFYQEIITTRKFSERLETLKHVREAEINVCSGGIIGMGESVKDRASMLISLSNLAQHPESVPINQLVKIAGTPLENVADLDIFDIVRCIAVARILMPVSNVRLSAGRTDMSDELQTLCFMAGANSIFYGEKLLTTGNPTVENDKNLLARLGMKP